MAQPYIKNLHICWSIARKPETSKGFSESLAKKICGVCFSAHLESLIGCSDCFDRAHARQVCQIDFFDAKFEKSGFF